jgi:hypothetical protein
MIVANARYEFLEIGAVGDRQLCGYTTRVLSWAYAHVDVFLPVMRCRFGLSLCYMCRYTLKR